MPVRSPTIPTRYVKLVVAYAESLGLERGTILAAAGPQDASFDDDQATITVDQFDAVLGAVARHSGRSDTGFEVGRRITFDAHGALGLAIPRCANVDQALAMVVRHYAFVTPSFTMSYRREAARGCVNYRPLVGMTHETLCAINEMHAVSYHFLLTGAVQGCLPPYDIYMPFEAPPHAARYRELAPARVHFGPLPMPEVRIEFDAATMNLPMALADPRFVSEAQARLDDWAPRVEGETSWSGWITLMLREAEDCQPTLAQVAAIVGLGPHTLARRLAREGRSFRDLASRARFERARDLLRRTRAPISQIAYRLGYADVGNFSNAFRRATGQSPRAFRASALSA